MTDEIKTESENDDALKVIRELMDKERSPEEESRLNSLVERVEEFETGFYKPREATEQEVTDHLREDGAEQ